MPDTAIYVMVAERPGNKPEIIGAMTTATYIAHWQKQTALLPGKPYSQAIRDLIETYVRVAYDEMGWTEAQVQEHVDGYTTFSWTVTKLI